MKLLRPDCIAHALGPLRRSLTAHGQQGVGFDWRIRRCSIKNFSNSYSRQIMSCVELRLLSVYLEALAYPPGLSQISSLHDTFVSLQWSADLLALVLHLDISPNSF